jgi:hypothetical protein
VTAESIVSVIAAESEEAEANADALAEEVAAADAAEEGSAS